MAATNLATTRRSLHGVAEAIVAGPQYRATGTLRLRQHPGGFGTVVAHSGFSLVAVVGTDLVVTRTTGDSTRLPLAGTLGELAESAGLAFGGLQDAYRDGSHPRPDQPIEVDADAAAVLADAWARGAAALRTFADGIAGPQQPVLWPEHFDIGLNLDTVNYGVSPGDETSAEPYAYVGPPAPLRGAFWNQPFGAITAGSTPPSVRAAARATGRFSVTSTAGREHRPPSSAQDHRQAIAGGRAPATSAPLTRARPGSRRAEEATRSHS
jgi:hypothetical protein